jgi:predicted Zn-dependent peptidase
MRFGRDDLIRFFASRYLAGNSVVCVSGGFDVQRMAEAIERAFRGMRIGDRTSSPAPPTIARGPSTFHARKPGSQTQLRVAFHTPGFLDAASTVVDVMLRVLDDGMSTPLHHRIFETRGLAYNVGADLESYTDVGVLNIDAACSHDNVAAVAQEMLLIAADLKERAIRDEDLEKARKRAVWSLEELLDSSAAMNGWYGEQELFRDAPSIEAEAAASLAVSAKDIQSVCGRIFCGDALHLTTVGVLSDRQLGKLEDLVSRFP